jgi:hypothetical protein
MHRITLTGPESLEHVDKMRSWLRPRLQAGERFTLSIEAEKRSVPQNSLIHPLIREIATDSDRPRDEESLRVLRYLLLEQWRSETRRQPMFERSLDGMRLVDVSRGTSELDKPDCSEFIEWLYAWRTHAVKT